MNLFDIRWSRGLSLREAARALGILASDLSKYERGVEPVPDVIQATMAEVYKISRDELAPMLPDREEINAREQQDTNFGAALKAITADAKEKGLGKGNGGVGELACPGCQGVLRYRVSGSNGHFMAKCSSGCIQFIT